MYIKSKIKKINKISVQKHSPKIVYIRTNTEQPHNKMQN